ncbi:MAG: protein-disulfide reductase DsbD family protein [Myxococcales bacterium]|jgi:hypothetical protein
MKIVSVVVILLALVGCNQQSEPAPAAAEPDPAPAGPAAPAAEPSEPAQQDQQDQQDPQEQAAEAEPTDKVEDPSFALTLSPVGEYEAGKLGSLAVSLEPRGEYHINQDYPMSIELTGPEGVSFPKPKLDKPDAAQFDDKVARFDVPFTAAAAGEHQIQAKVKFAVCTPETCVPDERTLALAVAVK